MVDTQLIFVSGKGGTGKSALTAAFALDRARQGQNVLAIDMNDSPGLAAHLGSSRLGYMPTQVRIGVFALSLDRTAALDEYLKDQLRIPQGAPTKYLSGVLTILAESAPGVREIISIGKPIFEVRSGNWDTVVVDAPPLGQFQAYLRAPRTIADLVPTGNVRKQASMIDEVLSDPDVTSTVLVTNPAELAMNETAEAYNAITTEVLGPEPTTVLNRLLPPSGINPSSVGQLPEGPVADAALLQTRLEAEQDEWATAMATSWSLPYLRGVLTPLEVALQLSDVLGAIK